MSNIPVSALASFGALLKYLRRRARLTQRDLSIALGYSESQVSRLETNHRSPDVSSVGALFLTALQIEDEPETAALLLNLAKNARGRQSLDGPFPGKPSPADRVEGPPDAGSGLRGEQPPRRDNLPYALTSFIGRSREITEVQRLLAPSANGSARLVTLTGSGGCGKTRLSLQVAAALLPAFSDGVWLVELAAVSDPALVPQAAVRALGLQLEGETLTLEERLVNALRSRQLLLVLDNCEHLIEAAAQLAGLLLRACSHLRILATSREVLGLPGETAYRVPSLPVPDASLQNLAALAQVEAVQLFIERARAALPSFALDESNAPAVARICQRLDGIPLAIELAAARVSVLRAGQIAERLEANFRLLSSSSRTTLPRHQTLRAAIDWSYALLSEPERSLLQRLAVFAGGWSLEAAGAVGAPGDAPLDDVQVLDLLSRLVDKSLVLVDRQPHQSPRYRMLEIVRQYAQEKLELAHESDETHRRHLAFFLALTETAEPKLVGPDQPYWLERLDQEHNNLREAVEWALAHEQVEAALRIIGALFVFINMRGYLVEVTRLALAAVELGKKTEEVRQSPWMAKALLCAGALLTAQQNPPAARPLLEDALQHYQKLNDLRGIGSALHELALCTFYEGDVHTAQQNVEVALRFAQEAGDHRGAGRCLFALGALARMEEQVQIARSLLDQSLVELEISGDPYLLFTNRQELAILSWLEGDTARARAIAETNLPMSRQYGGQILFSLLDILGTIFTGLGEYGQAKMVVEENYALTRSLGQRSFPIYLQSRLAELAYIQGDLAQARAIIEEAIREGRQVNADCLPWQFCVLGNIALQQDSLEEAGALIDECIALHAKVNYLRDLHYTYLSRGRVLMAKGDLTQARQIFRDSLAWSHSRGLIPEIPARIEALAIAAAAEGHCERAARLFGGASAQRQRMAIPLPPIERANYDRYLQAARAGLTPEEFQSAWDAGRSLPMEALVADALGETPG